MKNTDVLIVSKEAVKSDPAMQKNARGARKIMVTELYESKEEIKASIEWLPPKYNDEKCHVQLVDKTEIAVFNQFSSQDRHYHEKGTEIYCVMEGKMTINIKNRNHLLCEGDMVIINPGVVHEVRNDPQKSSFLCRVITVNCCGKRDKIKTDLK
jgi:mannose-6-phosphate isomerase-like protein (cupin superfamily)